MLPNPEDSQPPDEEGEPTVAWLRNDQLPIQNPVPPKLQSLSDDGNPHSCACRRGADQPKVSKLTLAGPLLVGISALVTALVPADVLHQMWQVLLP